MPNVWDFLKNVLKYGSETDMLLQLGLPSINAATVLQLIV